MAAPTSSSTDIGARQVVVLGGGLAGLSAAWVLSKRGYDVTVLEKTDHCGGLAVTKQKDGYSYDLGPHNIHTSHEHYLKVIDNNIEGLFEHSPSFRVYKRGRFVEYPIAGAAVITSLPLLRVPIAAASFVLAHVLMYLREPRKDSSFKDWIVNRFGRVLYKEYFEAYPEKVWGLPPEAIDRHVADARVPTVGLLDLIKSLLLRRPTTITHREFSQTNFYIEQGIGLVPEFFEREIRAAGGKIRLGVRVTGIDASESSVDRVTWVDEDSSQPESIDCDYLLSTIPVDELVTAMNPVPDEVAKASSDLRYRAGVLLFLEVQGKKVLPSYSIYFTEGTYPFSRCSDMGRYSDKMMPEGKTLLCFELPCHEGDDLWSQSVEQLKDLAIEAIGSTGLVRPEQVDGAFREDIPHFYPQFGSGYRDLLASIFRHLGSLNNCLSYGRQGGFAYVNTDQVTHLGFAAANSVMTQDAVGEACSMWFSMIVESAYTEP